jgi:transcriptional regulator with XRE-family HTH domain
MSRKPTDGPLRVGKKKGTAEVAARIKAFRVDRGWSHAELAKILGLTGPNAIYSWENRQYDPSPETFLKLANLAGSSWEYTKDFLRFAGVKVETLEQVGDRLRGERTFSAEENVFINALEKSAEALPFNAWMIANQASTRFLRLDGEDVHPFEVGDIVLVDPTETDLRKLNEDDFIAYSVEGHHHIGFLTKSNAHPNETRFLLRRTATHRNIYMGDSMGSGPVKGIHGQSVLGRIVGWIRQPHAHPKRTQRESDLIKVHRAGKPPRGGVDS